MLSFLLTPFVLPLAAATAALIYSLIVIRWLLSRPTGSSAMNQVSAAIAQGAAAYLNRQTKNCIVYPPVAFRTEQANTARWETFVSNLENFTQGKPQNVVN